MSRFWLLGGNGLEIEVSFEITEVNTRELAEMNQEFFDKSCKCSMNVSVARKMKSFHLPVFD